MTSAKYYAYCFTVNNWTDPDLQELQKLEDNPRTRYLVVGRETGENGTPHIQGYVYFHNQTVFSTVKKWISRAHIEPARGTPQEASDYCKKDGDFHEHGTLPLSQKRRGELGAEYWDDVKKKAKSGDLEAIDSKTFITHYSTLVKIATRYSPMPEDLEGVTGEWLYGDTETGKSRTARAENPDAYLKKAHKWWDNYKGQDSVIIEDFDKQHAYLGYDLKIWGDRYAFPAEIKGGAINLRPKKIVVTSNYHPEEIWATDPKTLEPILRRYKIRHFIGALNNSN